MWRGELELWRMTDFMTQSGESQDELDEKIEVLEELLEIAAVGDGKRYLTRLDSRMGPEAMTEDIMLSVDSSQQVHQSDSSHEFQARIRAGAGFGSELTMAAQQGDIDSARKLLKTGKPLFTIGIVSVTIGHVRLGEAF